MKINFVNSSINQEEQDFFIIVKDHRKIAKSKRRKLLRKFKKELLKERQSMNIRKAKIRKDAQCPAEENLWDVLDSDFLYPQNSSM